MSLAVLTAGGAAHDVLSGSITLRLRGVWGSLLELDADAPMSGAVEIALARDDGAAPQLFKGTIIYGAPYEGRVRIVVAGGAAKIAGPIAPILAPRNYVAGPKLSTIVADIAADAGEKLAAGVELELEGRTLQRWLRAAGLAADGLQLLGDRLEGWRVLPDGTLWAGAETWPEVSPAGLYQQGDDGHALVVDVAPEAATLLPGSVVLGRRIVQVVYGIQGALRASLHYQEPSA